MSDDLLSRVLREAVQPALALLPLKMNTPLAIVQVLTTGLQESRLVHRRQIVNGGGYGPANGLWQFERGGGVRGVLQHPATEKLARHVCAARDVDANSMAVWDRLAHDDVLAAAFARLLIYSDPLALPGMDDPEAGWRLYIRTWRPGKPHPETWAPFHRQVVRFVKGPI